MTDQKFFRPTFREVEDAWLQFMEALDDIQARTITALTHHTEAALSTEGFHQQLESILKVQFKENAFAASVRISAILESLDISADSTNLLDRMGEEIEAFEREAGPLPKKLKSPAPLSESYQRLKGFFEAKVKQLSAIRERITKQLRHTASQSFDNHDFEAEKEKTIAEYKHWLSQSDHLPVMINVDGIRVLSFNVQELVEDGIQHYLCRLPGVAGSKGTGKSKASTKAVLHECVIQEQWRNIMALLSEAFHLSTATQAHLPTLLAPVDVVCLQEVSRDLLALLIQFCDAHFLKISHTHDEGLLPTPAPACDAHTCAITPHLSSRPLPPVVVEVQENTKVNQRRFAGLSLGARMFLSIHVRHPTHHGKSKKAEAAQPEIQNEQNIKLSLVEIVRNLESYITAGFTIVCVGDFNGQISLESLQMYFKQFPELVPGTAFPDTSTSYGSDRAIDGAVCFAQSQVIMLAEVLSTSALPP